ncbi:hypothetical protein J8J32_22245, partial [Mycobacterium tuberculosis]|nr:hypothetical protein [Mycobacterium tuberculosis]
MFIGSGGMILFGLVIYYGNQEGRIDTVQQILMFCGIFLATVALGGLSDQRRWGGALWVALALLMPLVFVGQYE